MRIGAQGRLLHHLIPPHVFGWAIGTSAVHEHDLQRSVRWIAEAREGFVQVRHGVVSQEAQSIIEELDVAR